MLEQTTATPTLYEYFISDPMVTVIFLGFGTIIIIAITFFWHETRKVQSKNRLKRDMLERGMSPSEIHEVMKAGDPPWWQFW